MSHVVATDLEESFLGDVHLRGDDARVGDRPGGWDMLTTDPEESLLGDVHVRGGTTLVSSTDQGVGRCGHRRAAERLGKLFRRA